MSSSQKFLALCLSLLAVGLVYIVFPREKSADEQNPIAADDASLFDAPTSTPVAAATVPPLSTPVSTAVILDPHASLRETTDLTKLQGNFTHLDLPGFSFDYPDDWQITAIKNFYEQDSKGFVSHYYGDVEPCEDACMGVRLAKPNLSLDFQFLLALDDGGGVCSHTTTFQEIDDWFRVNASDGFYYAKTLLENFQTEYPEGGFFEENGDAAIKGEVYPFCVIGSGTSLLEPASPKFSHEGAILMEFPRIIGTPSPADLEEIDDIIRSIQGVESRPE